MSKRIRVKATVRDAILHESGYMCAVPSCKTLLTIQIHHIDHVEEGGSNDPANLVALCNNCHGRYHKKVIPRSSIRAWKMLLLSLNAAFDRRSAHVLLMLEKTGDLEHVSVDGLIQYADLVAANLVDAVRTSGVKKTMTSAEWGPFYKISLSDKGANFVKYWKAGDQEKAISGVPVPVSPGR